MGSLMGSFLGSFLGFFKGSFHPVLTETAVGEFRVF